MKNHQESVLKHLKSATITPLQALDLYGCYRLSSVIHRLRRAGYTIVTYGVETNGSHHAKYELIGFDEEKEIGLCDGS